VHILIQNNIFIIYITFKDEIWSLKMLPQFFLIMKNKCYHEFTSHFRYTQNPFSSKQNSIS